MTKVKDLDIEKLKSHYKDEIEEILIESEHVYRLTIDYEMLDKKVVELLMSARLDGLEDKMIWDLLQARIPSYVNYMNYKASGKKSA